MFSSIALRSMSSQVQTRFVLCASIVRFRFFCTLRLLTSSLVSTALATIGEVGMTPGSLEGADQVSMSVLGE